MTEGNRPAELAKLSLPEDRIRIETIRSYLFLLEKTGRPEGKLQVGSFGH
jgi:hypothetical protein